MACAVFEDYLRNVCVEMEGGKRYWCSVTTVLLIPNSWSISKVPIRLSPSHPNKRAVLRSIDQGIKFMKQWFRKKLICSLL